MTVKNRLTQFLEYKEIKQAEFCRSINVSTAFVSSMRVSIQPDKIKSIALAYPELNIKWLITGIGDMLEPNNEHINQTLEYLSEVVNALKSKDEQIDRLLKLMENHIFNRLPHQ